jgi:F-type H+-transporting ATPase subunit delta
VKAQELSHKYATAVFSQAICKWVSTLTAVQEALAGNSALVDKLGNTALPFADRQNALDTVIPADCDKNIRNFCYILLKEGDIGLLGQVIAELDRMTRGGPQVEVAQVTRAVELTEADQEQFRQKLRTAYGQGLEFVFNIDPAIMGGVVVQVGDKIIDGSVATRLASMANVLGVK